MWIRYMVDDTDREDKITYARRKRKRKQASLNEMHIAKESSAFPRGLNSHTKIDPYVFFRERSDNFSRHAMTAPAFKHDLIFKIGIGQWTSGPPR